MPCLLDSAGLTSKFFTTLNPSSLFRCQAEIDPDALRWNIASLRKRMGTQVGLMAVIKADAYGHGLEFVATELKSVVDWFCVANLAEAIRAKAAVGNDCPPILILSPLTPPEYEAAIESDFSYSVSTQQEVKAIGEAAAKEGKQVKLHAIADTGMGRMGALEKDWHGLVDSIRDHDNCLLEGVGTHFPNADEDPEFTRNQIAMFRSMCKGLDCEIHISNSAGIIDFSDEIEFATLARPGLSIYGVSPECQTDIELKPALTLKSRVTLVRDIPKGTPISYGSTYISDRNMQVASIAAGYGDGYPRHLSGNGADVLIGGKRCPVLGRVTMDQLVVDVSHLDGIKPGDEVVLIGVQEEVEISAIELAEKAGTIPWEIFTGITSRVERV